MVNLLVRQVNETEKAYRKLLKPYLQLAGKVYGYGILDASEEKPINFWNQLATWKSTVDSIMKDPVFQNLALKIYRKLAKRSAKELNKQTQRIIGIDVFGQEPWTDRFLNQQIKEHVALIKNVGEQIKKDIEEIVRRNASQGLSRERMIREIEEGLQGGKGRFKALRTRAELIARTETSAFYNAVTKKRMFGANLATFVWQSAGDSRVRPSHRARNGNSYSLSTGDNGIFPGSEPRCRCVMEINPKEFL